MASTDEITIRRAESQDCAQVYKLMQELALFLRSENDMVLTFEQLYKDLFGKQPVCYCIVATTKEDPTTLIGYSLYNFTYYYLEGFSIYMENLYVSQAHRGKGIGKTLWQEVAKIGLEIGSKEIQICVYNWNKRVKEWYYRNGCVDYENIKDEHYLVMSRKTMADFVMRS